MPDSAMDNTTSLSENGTIGTRAFSDYNAREISSQISRHNYRKAVISDSRMQEMRETVYRMVSGWLREDKLAIITEYGDTGLLSRNPSDKEINEICTESLIIHLKPEDLQTLYNDITKKEKRLVQDIKNINIAKDAAGVRAMAQANMKRRLNMRTFEEASKHIGGVEHKDYEKKRKEFDPDYGIPKFLLSQYRRLRIELNDVLTNCFNKVQINQMLLSMNIEFREDASFKDLKKVIINKTLLYVDLILGHGKSNFAAGQIMDPEPYNNLLRYTSYSYVTGEPGLDPSEWATLKRQAHEAKIAMSERSRMKENKWGYRSREIRALTGLTGGAKANSLRALSKRLRDNDSGILSEASYDQLIELAGKYGIDPTSKQNRSVAVLKAKIYNAMGNEARRIQKLTNAQNKMTAMGRHSVEIDRALATHASYSDNSILGLDSGSETESSKVPIIKLSKSGKILNNSILRAVPVYIIGSGFGGSLENNEDTSSHLALGGFGSTRERSDYMKLMGYSKVDRSDLSEEELSVYQMINNLESKPLPLSRNR